MLHRIQHFQIKPAENSRNQQKTAETSVKTHLNISSVAPDILVMNISTYNGSPGGRGSLGIARLIYQTLLRN